MPKVVKTRTDNNPHRWWDVTTFDKSDIDFFKNWVKKDQLLYCHIGQEICPVTNKDHWHIRVGFKRNYRFTQLKKLHPVVHWQASKAVADNLYMMKKDTDDVFHHDSRSPGKRSDMEDCIESIKKGDTIKQLWVNHPSTMVRYNRGLKELHGVLHNTGVTTSYPELRMPLNTDWSKSIIVHGPSNCGKTEWALAHFKNALFVTVLEGLLSYDPEVHDGIVFDDMSFYRYDRTIQIHLTDINHPRSIKVRYTNAHIPAFTKKIFTTNERKGSIFTDDPAILRRIKFIEFSSGGGNSITFPPPLEQN